MITPESKKILESLSSSVYGKALQEFLDEQYDIINDVTACKDWEDTVGRRYALETLERLFGFMRVKKVSEKPPNQYE